MADTTYTVKKITDLAANSTANDTDVYVLGNQGTATMRRITFSTIASAILNKLASFSFSSLTTSSKNLPGAVNELNSKMELTAVTYTAQYTCSANNALILTASDFGLSTPSGYTPLLMTYATTGNNNVLIRAFGLGIGSNILVLRNVSSSDATSTATIRVLYIKYGRI